MGRTLPGRTACRAETADHARPGSSARQRRYCGAGIRSYGIGLVRPAALAVLRSTSEVPFGLIHIVPLPPSVRFVVAFLLMDLLFYWWHLANHRIPFLWRFHNVHHIDPDLDVSTAFRFHFGEIAMSAGFRALQIGVIGLSAPMFAAYELVFQANTLFHHSNVRLPIGVERWLALVLVTPRMHGIHHSQARDESQLELLGGLLVVGQAAPDDRPQRTASRHRRRCARVLLAR